MVTDHIRKVLQQKSTTHQMELERLGQSAEDAPLTSNVTILEETPQVLGVNSIILDPKTDREDFIFYFDRMAGLLIEKYISHAPFHSAQAYFLSKSMREH